MEWYKVILGLMLAAIIAALLTGHRKLAAGIASGSVLLIVLFYAAVFYALWRWSRNR